MRIWRTLLIIFFITILVNSVHAQGCDATADTPAALVELANTCNLADDYERALTHVNQAVALDPNYAPAAYVRAITHMNMGNYERALVDLRYAQDLRYENPQYVHTLMGWAHYNLGDYQAAIADFEQAIALDPNDDFPYWGLGDAYRALGEYDRAVAYYHRHIDLAGENAAPVVRAYVAGYEGDPLPTSSTSGGRTNWEILGGVLLAIIGVGVRFSFARNIWRRNVETPKKPKAQQVYEQTRDLERAYERENVAVDFSSDDRIKVKKEHPDNGEILNLLQRSDLPVGQPPPEKIGRSGVGGSSPELVAYIWGTLAQMLPENCNWRVYGRVALVHPDVGLVFGVGMSSGLVALRLPEAERKAAIAAMPTSLEYRLDNGTMVYARRFGPEWVFVGTNAHKWVRAAFDYTGQQGRRKLTRADYQ